MSLRASLLAMGILAMGGAVFHWLFADRIMSPGALAQNGVTPPAINTPVPAAPAVSSRVPQSFTIGVKVDESALRYFASQGDTRRLEAEIARLKALYPDWTPPTNYNAPAPTGDAELDRIWKLFADGQLSEARSAIAQRIAVDSRWQPPQDLLDKLGAAEAMRRLVNAFDAKQWATVIDVATQNSSLLTCDNVDALWRVAEAFTKTDKPERARDAYRYILLTCNNLPERLATIQKASQLMSDQDVRDLLKLERPGSDGKGEFAAIRLDLARARVGNAARDPKIAVDPQDLSQVERVARDGNSADDALVVGYYYYSHNDAERSLEWFKRAVDRQGGARAAEGYALALIELKRFAEAEAAAEPFRTATSANTKVYLTAATALLAQTPPPRVEPSVLARATAATNDARDATAAQALGWYAYNIGQVQTAADWFSTSLQWQSNSEPAAFGLALTRQRLGDRAGLQRIMAQWRGRSQRIADILSARRRISADTAASPVRVAPDLAPAPLRLAPPQQTGSASTPTPARTAAPVERVILSQRSARPASTSGCRGSMEGNVWNMSAGASLGRGWCLMNLRRYVEAAQAFEVAQQRGSGQVASDAAYGRSLAYLALGLTADAAMAASSNGLPPARRAELNVAIVTQKALAAYREGRYRETLINLDERSRLKPEQTDLLMLRGWSYFNLGRYSDAEQVFTAVSKTGSAESDEALRGLNAIKQKLGQVRE